MLKLDDQNDTDVEEVVTAATVPFINDSTFVNARIVLANNTLQVANGSFRHIASLEVYRGRRQITVINHNGFSLSDRGTIEVYITCDTVRFVHC